MAESTRSEAVSAPAGTGNAPGLGEAFTLDLNTGQASYAVALTLPEGVAGWHPTIKLEYRHGAPASPFGQGWDLPVRSIQRRLDLGVPAGGDDPELIERFLADGSELIEEGAGSYRNRFETAFNRYRREGDGWVLEERTGARHELGSSPVSRVTDPDAPDRVISWLLDRSIDTSGNEITYTWVQHEGWAYLASVSYAIYRIDVTYEDRPDPRRNGRAGFLRELRRRATGIELHAATPAGDRLVRRWELTYRSGALTAASLLDQIQLRSFGPAGDGSDDVVRPPQRFTYSEIDASRWRARFLDADPVSPPPPLTEPDTVVTTLGRGVRPGVLQTRGSTFVFWPAEGSGFGAPKVLRDTPPIAGLREAGAQLLDLDGDGRVDLLVGVGGRNLRGYYEGGGEVGFSRFVAYPRSARAVPPFEGGRTRMVDLSGDGRIDALASAGRAYATWTNEAERGWAAPTARPIGDGDDGPDADLADPLVRLADMTGDGLADLVRIRSGRVEYWPNLGRGRFGARVIMGGSPRIAAAADPRQFHLVDLDGDGCADLVEVGPSGVRVFANQAGNAFADPVVDPLVPPPVPGTVIVASADGRTGAGLLWCASRPGLGRRSAYVSYDLTPGPPANHLTGVDNGAGLVSAVEYSTAADEAERDRAAGEPWALGDLPFPTTVVSRTSERDTITGQVAASDYRYHDGFWDPRTRTFEGFARVEKVETGHDSRPGTRTEFHFRVAEDQQAGAAPEAAALNRMLRRTDVYQLDGGPDEDVATRSEETDHEVVVLLTTPDHRRRVWVRASRTVRRWTERTDDERVEERTYDYDGNGNVVREVTRWSGTHDGVAEPEQSASLESVWATDLAQNLIDRPARATHRDDAGVLVAETIRLYDGAAFTGLAAGDVGRGLVSRELRWIGKRQLVEAHYAGLDLTALGYTVADDGDGDEAVYAITKRRSYDAAGRIVGERSPTGATTTFTYDGSGLFRDRTDGPLGVSLSTFDPVVGKAVSMTDPDGRQVSLGYDAQGRLLSVVLPGDTDDLPSRSYTYDDVGLPNSVRVAHRIEHGGAATLDTAIYFDGRLKEIERRVTMDTGRVVVSGHQVRNPWGDTAVEYEPTFAPSLEFTGPTDGELATRPATRFSYDGDGRPVRTELPGGGVATASYRPFEIESRDATDNDDSADNVARGQFDTPRLERLDVRHRRVQVIETTTPGDREAGAVVSTFTSSPLGLLVSHVDDEGEVTRCTYDGLGNRLKVVHRDAGDRRLFYDASQRVVRTTDASGTEISAAFDGADRVTAVEVDGVPTEAYAYDDLATGGHGRLRRVTYPGGAQTFAYNERGQVVAHDYEVDGHPDTFTFGYRYDALGKQKQVDYPDGATVRFEHYVNGMPKAAPGFVDAIDYDARMQPTEIRFANGVTTTIDHLPGPGRVTTLRTVGPPGGGGGGNTVLDDQTFAYDAGRHLLGVTFATPGGTGEVAYSLDPLHQLTRAVDSRGADTDVSYDYRGRRLVANGESDVRLLYEDPAHPGRVSHMEQDAVSTPLGYDANGALTGLPGRTFTFGPKGELARVTHDDGAVVDYRYDHQGHRLSKSATAPGPAGAVDETLFFGSLAELRADVWARFVVIGETRVALVRQGTTRWIHTDPLGSATFFTDQAGSRISRISYHAFGNPRAASGTAPRQVFALHDWDADAGLYFMQRRYYAPELGRFISPDALYLLHPEKGLSDPRRLELYTYAGNDPIDNVDPSGASFWTVLGAIVGVIVAIVVAVVVVAAFACGIGWGLLAIAGVIGLIVGGYSLASTSSGAFGDFMKGMLIGLNAGLNAIILSAFGPVGIVLGVVVGVIAFLGAFDSVRQSPIYQGVLGWSSWVMPMSWLVNAVGLIFFVVSLILAGVTFQQVDALKIEYIHFDWGTGSFVMKGGALANANPIDTAYDMGNFVFVDGANTAPDDDVPHELGHALSLGLFGSVVHFIGFIDEMGGIGGANAWTERMADSHSPRRRGEIIAAGGTPDDTWG